ncbi:MAG: hypothetical protein ACI4XJ_08255 [Eubacteriales bacterium]
MKKISSKEQLSALLEFGNIRIVTDCGEIDLSRLSCMRENYVNVYETSFAKITVSVYEKSGKTVYRDIKLYCKSDLTLFRIDFLIDFPDVPKDFIEYKSFINAPAAAFIRYDDIGYYTGAENPFFSASADGNTVCVSYEPSLILKNGETYDSEPQFLGCYEPTGQLVKEKDAVNIEAVQRGMKRTRFFNPCGEIALDTAEIDAMLAYVNEYYSVTEKSFDNILYFFFYPKKRLPETESEIQDYLSTIDRFAEISGDIIAFNPHTVTEMPSDDKPYWELVPKNSPAERILHHAQGKGLRCGYYMGCAVNGGTGGNAGLLPFMPQKTEWKKKDEFGNTAKENCLACDDYLDWWYTVQKNTIEKYDLGYWSWDPGPGNGNDCYAENHGHIPGKGEYKGWRNSQRLLARLKSEFPHLFLMSFYGRKEYGLWGFRYFSQHEVYWEQTIMFGATLYNDLHDDRVNACGVRLQNQWSMNFRFLPAHIGHGLVTRMGESWFDPSMDRAYDFGGYKYALISAIACCGSVTHCNLPDRLENVPGFAEFYRKWIKWAKDNYRYCEFTRPIADCVSNQVIDGFSRIDKDSGQIFLFNSSPKGMNKKITLGKNLGIDTDKKFCLRILYCENLDCDSKKIQYRGEYSTGDLLDITLPPYCAIVLELSNTPADRIDEIPRNTHTVDRFTDDSGNLFEYPIHDAYENIELNAHAVFTSELKSVLDNSHIPNEAFLEEKIPEWHKSGMPFTFVSALPYHLVMYIPFDSFKLPEEVQLYINGIEVPTEIFKLNGTPIFNYAFVEDYVKWDCDNSIKLRIKGLAENSFMGIHIDYPDSCDGVRTEETVFSENNTPSSIHPDSSLVIKSFTVTPDVLPDTDERFTVCVKTDVEPERIENIYFLHPTMPQMPALNYDEEDGVWKGEFSSGTRALNIFCNPTINAWIRAKDGGVGPRAECRIKIRYTK